MNPVHEKSVHEKSVQGQIHPHDGRSPVLADDVYVAPGAQVIGDVEIGAGSSIWFNTVVRGDVHHIRIGSQSNIQDGCVCHVTTDIFPLIIGDRVSVGHMVVLHGCTVESDSLIGIGSIILDEAVVGEGSFIAAGSLITPRTIIPPGSLVMGCPGKVIRPVAEREIEVIRSTAPHYMELARSHVHGTPRPRRHG